MKTIKSIFITCLVFGYTVNKAQTTETENSSGTTSSKRETITSSKEAKDVFVWGLKAGVNRSNIYDSQTSGLVANSKNGFAGGLFVAIPLGTFIGIQPEILFSQRGFSADGKIGDQNYTVTRTTNYLDIPLQLQIKPFRFLSLYGGVQYSYLMNQNDKFAMGSTSVQQSQEFSNNNIRKNTLGAVTGLDINVDHIVLSGRAGWDLQRNTGDGSSYTPRYKNLWLQATIGYRFY